MARIYITRDIRILGKKTFALLIIALIAVSSVSIIEYYYLNNDTTTHFTFGTQHIAIYVNGKLIAEKTDAINGLAYDYITCKVFNDSTACNQLSQGNGIGYGGTPTWTGGSSTQCQSNSAIGSATVQSQWKSATYCSLLAVGLSSNTQTIGNGGSGSQLYCPTQISGNGFNPVKAVSSHTVGTNSIILTASWTAGASTQSNLGTACLFPYNDVDGKTGLVSGIGLSGVGWPPILIDLLPGAPLTVSAGASLSLTWTITF